MEENKNKYDTYNNLPIILLEIDFDYKILFVNDFALNFFGYTNQELVNKNLSILLEYDNNIFSHGLITSINSLKNSDKETFLNQLGLVKTKQKAVYNISWNIIEANKTAIDMLEYSLDKLKSMTMYD